MQKVTVLMSIYNGEKYLSEAIDSILAQTFSDFEFLIIDDASTDKTSSILVDYQKQDKRIRVVTNSNNIGLTRSLNIGIGLAQGMYIARMDADDISLPPRLEKQVLFLDNNPEYAVVGSWFIRVAKGQEVVEQRPSDYRHIASKLFYGNPIAHPTVMFVKAIVISVGGYNEKYRTAQDYGLWWSLVGKHRLTNIPEVLLKYRQHEEMVSVTKKKDQDGNYDKIRKKNYWKAVFLSRGRVFVGSIAWRLFRWGLS